MKSIKIIKLTLSAICLFSQFLPAYAQKKHSNEHDFLRVVQSRLDDVHKIVIKNGRQVKTKGLKLSEVCSIETDAVARRIFVEYGAVFIADDVEVPTKCIFQNEAEVLEYQNSVSQKTETIDGVTITLQEAAMEALLEARKHALKKNLKITPRGGSIAARRSYAVTQRLWNSRFFPALNHWVRKGKIPRREAELIKNLEIMRQVERVFEYEDRDLCFSKDLSKSILYSVAAPGASQHIFMLALDIEQFGNKEIREILARHGWFQTVQSDLPHFTYLGLDEEELPEKGLKAVFYGSYKFWIPDLKDKQINQVKSKR